MRSASDASSCVTSGRSWASSSSASGNVSIARSYMRRSSGSSGISRPYWPLKSTISTAPVAATSVISSGDHAAVTSSLKRRSGMDLQPAADRVERRRLAEPERVDEPHRLRRALDHLVQRRPAWLSARSSAADSNAQLRQRRAMSHPAGPATGRARAAGRTAPRASTRRPAAAPAGARAACRPRSRTARRPRRGPPRRRRAGGPRSSPARSRRRAVACRRSNSYDSIRTGSALRRSHGELLPSPAMPQTLPVRDRGGR